MAPFITTLLGSGLRLIANAVLVKGKEFIEEKTGIKFDTEQKTLSQEDRLKLEQFQMEHEEELLRIQLENNKLDIEELKAYLKDVSDARSREIQIATSANVPNYVKATPTVLAWGVIGFTFILFAFFVYFSGETDAKGNPVMTASQKDLIIYILGVLSAAVTQILGYYFGSSQGSAAKSDQINQALQNKQNK